MTQQKIEALSRCRDAFDRLDFFGSNEPKCPHCGAESVVSGHEWWHLYEEGEHSVSCPSCDLDYTVSTRVSYSFSTDNQEET